MGFFKSLKGDLPTHIGGSSNPQPSSSASTSKKEKKTDAARAGANAPEWTANQPPPYHNWEAVPDTSLLPPPPAIGNTQSPTGNAERVNADRAHAWCERNPLVLPHEPLPAQVEAIEQGRVEIQRPREYVGSLDSPEPGYWVGSSKHNCTDSALLSSMPLYFENVHSPYRTERPKTIYFEVKVHSFGSRSNEGEASLAIGFCSVPYPTWRLPGWERGSLAVHSDDGRRYVNDTWGGVDFTSAFQPGETIGIGMTFSVPERPQDFASDPVQGRPLKGRVFLTRNGANAGDWDLHESLDSENEFGAFGVDGKYDLYAAIGIYGKVEFEAVFQPHRWLYQP